MIFAFRFSFFGFWVFVIQLNVHIHSGSRPLLTFASKTVVAMAENQDLGRGPPNITDSGSLGMVGLSTLI